MDETQHQQTAAEVHNKPVLLTDESRVVEQHWILLAI